MTQHLPPFIHPPTPTTEVVIRWPTRADEARDVRLARRACPSPLVVQHRDPYVTYTCRGRWVLPGMRW